MRAILALAVVIYFVGVGVALAPTIRSNWSTGVASQLAENVAQELPGALAWPATIYRRVVGTSNAASADAAPQ